MSNHKTIPKYKQNSGNASIPLDYYFYTAYILWGDNTYHFLCTTSKVIDKWS